MSRSNFQFKRFTIDQADCAMKVGTDGVLLGAWCRVEPTDEAVLDIGTGTGVIALQLAQRTENFDTLIEAVEIDPAACGQAQRNFDASEWGGASGRIKLHTIPVQELAEKDLPRFDHIVSNPPYFADSLTSPDPSRTTARHTATLSYEDLVSACDRLLKPDGRISLVLPAGVETEKMIAVAASRGFIARRRTEVHSTRKSGPKRTLLEFSRRKNEKEPAPETASLTIEGAETGTFSEEYRTLTRDFYLYF